MPNTVIPAAPPDPVETTIPHNLKMLTEKHNDGKLAITVLMVGAAWRLAVLTLHLVCLQIMVQRNAKDMI